MRVSRFVASIVCAAVVVASAGDVLANGGPFVVRYPTGDPAAKGVLARLDPDLKPGRETKLRVEKEDLTFTFKQSPFGRVEEGQPIQPPLATIVAAYTIENPTDEEVKVDFGFPILRGIYMSPWSMMPRPDAQVTLTPLNDAAKAALPDLVDAGYEYVPTTVISNSAIYGIIRQKAREAIEKGIAGDEDLAKLVARVKAAAGKPEQKPVEEIKSGGQPQPQPVMIQKTTAEYEPARKALNEYLVGKLKWDKRDAMLMVEYAGIHFPENGDNVRAYPMDRPFYDFMHRDLTNSNLGPLGAIGEQKATQLFAQLANRFDEKAAASYKALFEAWGGDVRERSIDLTSGKIRPREIALPKDGQPKPAHPFSGPDPTVYARVEYLNPNAMISDTEKAACKSILKNLPVVFTFAPMNLLHYEVKFPPKAKQIVTITYSQFPYDDTAGKPSYQLGYVLHPASLWDDFGPINLKINLPKGLDCKASVPIKKGPSSETSTTYMATLDEAKLKKGEMFIAVEKAAWEKALKKKPAEETAAVKVGKAASSN